MSDPTREKLREIILQSGQNIVYDTHYCGTVLRDELGETRRDLNVLTLALNEDIPASLLGLEKTPALKDELGVLAKKLEEAYSLTSSAACWAIESWAIALGLIKAAVLTPEEAVPAGKQKPAQDKKWIQLSVGTGKPADHAAEPLPDIPSPSETPGLKLADIQNKVLPRFKPLLKLVENQVGTVSPEWVRDYLLEGDSLPRWLTDDKVFNEVHWLRNILESSPDLAKAALQAGFLRDQPAWYHELVTRYQAGVARLFILYGNINDYVFHPNYGYLPLADFLKNQNENCQVVYQYNLAQGIQVIHDDRISKPESAANATEDDSLLMRVRRDLRELDSLVRSEHDGGALILIELINKLFPPNAGELDRDFFLEMILHWAIDENVLKGHNLVIMTTPALGDIHQDLRISSNKVDLIEIPRPDRLERHKFLLGLYASCQYGLSYRGRTFKSSFISFDESLGRGRPLPGIEQLANISSGLNRMGLEDMVLRSQVENHGKMSSRYITTHKKNLLASESAGLLEVIEPSIGFDGVGGIHLIIDRLKQICDAVHSPNELVRQTVPMGILFFGPPGTGKTYVAEALAKESGLNFVKLGNIREMWVGQSERNLSLVLNLISTMEPVIVFIDEIDQSEGKRSRGGDSGTGGRIFSKLLEFMSDTALRSKVIWIGASNCPWEIDAAMKRSGRFDLKLPFFLPELEDRKQIFRVLLRKKKIPFDPQLDFNLLGEKSDYYSGADIDMIINEALRIATIRSRGSKQIAVTTPDFQQAMDSIVLGIDPESLKQMEMRMLKDIPFREFWPERYRNLETLPDSEMDDGF